MRTLLCTTGLATVLIAAPAAAQTVTIDNDRTTPIATATASNGGPADIVIDEDGSIEVDAPAAVTVNSANDVKNEGEITISDRNNAVGIDVTTGGSATITNSGSITIDEDYEPEDDDDDDDIDGPFAEGTGRYGIRTGGAFTGAIVNSGDIAIEGNNSAGIWLGGAFDGSLTNSGDIEAIGDDSVGIRTEDVDGNVTVRGTVGVQGENAVGVAVDGDVTGRVTIQGAVATTGYRYTTAPSETEDLDADDLLQGGPAVRIAGNVGGGVIVDAPPPNEDEDEDDEDEDGIPDAQEGTGAIRSFGAAPALQIGSASADIALGAADASGHGLVIKGGVEGLGVYTGVNATAVSIGGLGGAVDLGDGIAVSGTIAADGRADSTGLALRDGAIAPEIDNSGTISARGGGGEGHDARAISIEAGAEVDTIVNSGTIGATASGKGVATAIYDGAGTLELIENDGVIAATGASAESNQSIAIDLRLNDSGVTVRQMLAGEDEDAPIIAGNVLMGDGDDLFNVRDGRVEGNVDFAGGSNRLLLSGDAAQIGDVAFGSGADALALTGTARVEGEVDFGGGADTLSLAEGTRFSGTLAGSSGLAASVSGTLDITDAGPVTLASLDVASTGVLGVVIDGAEGVATRYDVAGAADFADGATFRVRLNGIAESLGDYVIVDAGTLTGAEGLETADAVLPYLFKSSLDSDAEAGTVTLSIDRKTATELGLNTSESSAYDAIFNVLDADEEIADLFLSIGDQETLRNRFGSFLPEHAGGTFESITLAARASARFLSDRVPDEALSEGWTSWVQQIAWGSSKDVGDTAAFDVGGWGLTGGVEHGLGGAGHAGLSLGFALGRNANGDNDNEVMIDQYELGAYWRGQFGGFGAYARGAVAKIDFDGQRRIYADDLTRVAKASWGGTLYTLSGGISYELAVGNRLRIRPQAAIDHYRLSEDGWADTGGGEAFDIIVEERKSDETVATGTLALGYELGSLDPTETWLRLEVEGGRREIVAGEIASTVARFGDGDPFTLDPEQRESGWLGRVRLTGGVDQFSVIGEVGAEEQQFNTAFTARLGFKVGW